jgi:Alpha amylase, catalytic domain/Maltogenic Amylase, C-terminal domain
MTDRRKAVVRTRFFRSWLWCLLLPGVWSTPLHSLQARDADAVNDPPTPHASSLPARWWESASAIRTVSLKDDTRFPQLSLEPSKAQAQIRAIKDQGFTGLNIFAPADGGKSYNGLDGRDHYRIEPKYGTMDDFRRLVGIAHGLGMSVIIFENVGYSAVDAPSFLKACDDVREGRASRESRWFFWSDRSNVPPPASGDTFFFVRPTWLPNYEPEKFEHWSYSERAKHYYWTRWPGKDADGKIIDLPQYNWNSVEWQEEAEKITRFWLDTGIDGIVMDAVNWYVGYTWSKGHQRITDVVNSYGNKYSQPEGGGAFHDDPVAWITEGGWISVQDYGLSIWWEKPRMVLLNAIEAGDPRPIEESLRNYHDRVVAAGGTLNMMLVVIKDSPEQQHLAAAIIATTGQFITDWSEKDDKLASDPEIQWLLKTKAAHHALYQMGLRRKLPTNDDSRFYAYIRSAADGSERVLVVTNFWATSQNIRIDMSGLNADTLTDLRNGEKTPVGPAVELKLPRFGYRLFAIQ